MLSREIYTECCSTSPSLVVYNYHIR